MKATITKALLVIVTIMISHLSTNAKPVTQQVAHNAGKHWLDANPQRVTSGNPKKIRIQRELAFNNSKIRILELDDSGYIIVANDDSIAQTASIYPTGGVGYDMATTAVTEDGQTLVFAPKDSQIVISTNCGMNWTMEQSWATAWNQCACSRDGKEIIVTSTDDNTMCAIATISNDAGKTWTAIAPNDQAGNGAVACSRDGQVIGIIDETVLASTNSGSSWFSTTPGDYSTPVGKNGQLAISADGNKWVVAGHDESIKFLTLNLRPTIEIAHSTNGVKLQWTVPSSPIIIEQSSDFVNWTQIENSCETIGAKQYLSIEPSNKMFYRLGK